MNSNEKAPDEKVEFSYSHDYPNDTQLIYIREGNHAHLTIAFTSEDPDMGTEEMEYNGDSGESFAELISDARSEITSYLDHQDTSSFYEQQGELPADGIHSLDDYFGEFSRTSLYAFENALREAEAAHLVSQRELMTESSEPCPIPPLAIELKSCSGFRKNVFEGWKKLEGATIEGEGYKVEFSRLSERTIDRMCDSLNGYYNIWTKFLCEYSDAKGQLSIAVRKPEEADKIFKAMSDIQPLTFEHEGTMSPAEVARTRFETIISFIKEPEKEKPSVVNELKRLARKPFPQTEKPIEMEI